ncbi:MAG: 30S ribosomal protein S13 [Candidatus Desantisbacteria bacterium]
MARLVGVDLPKQKRIEIALTYIYGIGLTTAQRILSETEISPDIRTKDLTEEQITSIKKYLENNLKLEGDVRREVAMNIKRLIEVGSYRGLRHRRGLPVRGQRTHTNARTRRGPKKTIGAKRKS